MSKKVIAVLILTIIYGTTCFLSYLIIVKILNSQRSVSEVFKYSKPVQRTTGSVNQNASTYILSVSSTTTSVSGIPVHLIKLSGVDNLFKRDNTGFVAGGHYLEEVIQQRDTASFYPGKVIYDGNVVYSGDLKTIFGAGFTEYALSENGKYYAYVTEGYSGIDKLYIDGNEVAAVSTQSGGINDPIILNNGDYFYVGGTSGSNLNTISKYLVEDGKIIYTAPSGYSLAAGDGIGGSIQVSENGLSVLIGLVDIHSGSFSAVVFNGKNVCGNDCAPIFLSKNGQYFTYGKRTLSGSFFLNNKQVLTLPSPVFGGVVDGGVTNNGFLYLNIENSGPHGLSPSWYEDIVDTSGVSNKISGNGFFIVSDDAKHYFFFSRTTVPSLLDGVKVTIPAGYEVRNADFYNNNLYIFIAKQ